MRTNNNQKRKCSGKRLQSVTNVLQSIYEKESISRRDLSELRAILQKAQELEEVLLSRLPVGRVERKKSPNQPRKSFWNLMIKEPFSGHLPVFYFGNQSKCTYCGDPADTRDHIIPVSYQQTSRKAAFSGCGPMTYACRNCNLTLSNRWFDTFKQRCEWMSWRISQKAAPILWSNHQIQKLDHSLRSYVHQKMMRNKWFRFRADFYESREYILNIENLSWEMQRIEADTIAKAFLFAYFSETLNEIAELYKLHDPWRD